MRLNLAAVAVTGTLPDAWSQLSNLELVTLQVGAVITPWQHLVKQQPQQLRQQRASSGTRVHVRTHSAPQHSHVQSQLDAHALLVQHAEQGSMLSLMWLYVLMDCTCWVRKPHSRCRHIERGHLVYVLL
jgi:hypothetical protein